jgi:hypothetical protein
MEIGRVNAVRLTLLLSLIRATLASNLNICIADGNWARFHSRDMRLLQA